MSDDLEGMIPKEYEVLKSEFIRIRKEYEETKQELYGVKRNHQLLETLQNDYQGEIELLQSKIDNKNKISEEKIQQLEEYVSNLKLKHNEEVQLLETNISKYEEENKQLNNEIEILKKGNSSEPDGEYINKLTDEICNLKEENLNILTHCEELKIEFENLQKHTATLENTYLEAKQDIEELKNSLCSKTEQLRDTNELVEKLNEELMTLRTELEQYKSQPTQNCERGNSLFAEVDDRRVYLQQTINNMKSDYMNMKQERARHLRDLHRLKIENKKLMEKWKTDLSEKNDDHDTELKMYGDRIAVLEDLVERYKKDLNSKEAITTKDSFEGFEFYQGMIKDKNKEIDELRNQLSTRTVTEMLLSRAVNEANAEKRRWKLEASLKQSELELLHVAKQDSEEKSIGCIKQKSMVSQNIEEEMVKQQGKSILKNARFSKNFAQQTPKQVDSNNTNVLKTSTQNDLQHMLNKNSKTISTDLLVLEDSILDKSDKSINNTNSNGDMHVLKKSITQINEETFCINTDNKENLNDVKNVDCISQINDAPRRVAFTADTVSPKITGRRKCKKVIVCKPVVLSTSFK